MLELSEEEEISGSVERKHPRGSQTCLTLTLRASSDTSTIFTIVIFKNAINRNYFSGRLYCVQPPLHPPLQLIVHHDIGKDNSTLSKSESFIYTAITPSIARIA